MPSMIDVRCAACGKRYGFCGEMTDQPNCPKCGKEPNRAELEKVQAQMDEAERLMLLHPKDAKPNDLQRQRVQAGLTLRQAAEQLRVEARLLADLENGRCELSAELAQSMGKLYDCGDAPTVS